MPANGSRKRRKGISQLAEYWTRQRKKQKGSVTNFVPGYRFLGPGTDVSDAGAMPVNRLDRVAQTHDYGYGVLQKKGVNPYFNWNSADDRMLAELENQEDSSFMERAVARGLKLKRAYGRFIGHSDKTSVSNGSKRQRNSRVKAVSNRGNKKANRYSVPPNKQLAFRSRQNYKGAARSASRFRRSSRRFRRFKRRRGKYPRRFSYFKKKSRFLGSKFQTTGMVKRRRSRSRRWRMGRKRRRTGRRGLVRRRRYGFGRRRSFRNMNLLKDKGFVIHYDTPFAVESVTGQCKYGPITVATNMCHAAQGESDTFGTAYKTIWSNNLGGAPYVDSEAENRYQLIFMHASKMRDILTNAGNFNINVVAYACRCIRSHTDSLDVETTWDLTETQTLRINTYTAAANVDLLAAPGVVTNPHLVPLLYLSSNKKWKDHYSVKRLGQFTLAPQQTKRVIMTRRGGYIKFENLVNDTDTRYYGVKGWTYGIIYRVLGIYGQTDMDELTFAPATLNVLRRIDWGFSPVIRKTPSVHFYDDFTVTDAPTGAFKAGTDVTVTDDVPEG